MRLWSTCFEFDELKLGPMAANSAWNVWLTKNNCAGADTKFIKSIGGLSKFSKWWNGSNPAHATPISFSICTLHFQRLSQQDKRINRQMTCLCSRFPWMHCKTEPRSTEWKHFPDVWPCQQRAGIRNQTWATNGFANQDGVGDVYPDQDVLGACIGIMIIVKIEMRKERVVNTV